MNLVTVAMGPASSWQSRCAVVVTRLFRTSRQTRRQEMKYNAMFGLCLCHVRSLHVRMATTLTF